MGIPSFYAWLRKRYPLILYNVKDESKEMPIFDNFYIDFNALVYKCVKEEHHFLMDQLTPRSFDDIYNRVIEYVDILIDKVNPQKLLFISVDGVVPRAKVNQSRQRRFKAGRHMDQMQDLFKLIGVEDIENFKGNSISPGTEFLYTLCTKLKSYVLAKMDSDWKHLNVVFSDCTVPGQGEQKIMEFLRACISKNFFPKETNHCIYSPDADFFLLSLSSRLKNIAIIREEFAWSEDKSSATIRQISQNKFEFVIVSILRQYFEYQFREVASKIKNFDIYRVIDDFILIMMFVGNDFLPRMFCFGIREGHLNDLLEKYKEYLCQREDYINNGGKIDWKNVERLLEIAKEFETTMIQEKLLKSKQSSQNSEQSPRGRRDQWDDQVANNFEIEHNTITKGRSYYYKTRFDINIDDPNDQKKFEQIIIKYLEGLEFYCTYYYLGCQSWSWFYPYHYTPLLADVYEYLRKNKINEVKLPVKGEPFDPLMALMFMMPQQSFGLLPQAIRKVLEDPTNQLRGPEDYYSNDFEMDKFSNPQDLDKKALVPFLDETMVRNVYSKIPKEAFTKEQQNRNVLHDPLFLRRDGSGKDEKTSGFEFNLKKDSSINEVIKVMNKPTTQTRKRLPTLKIYGDTIKNTKTGFQIIVNDRYKSKHQQDQLVFFNNFQGYIEETIPIDRTMQDRFGEVYGKLGLIGKAQNYFRIKLARLVRDIEGFKLVKLSREVFVPDYAVFSPPDYDYLRRTRPYTNEDWPQFGERVVLLRKDCFGWIGVVEAAAKTLNVRITEKSQQLDERVEQIDTPYYTINSVATSLNLSRQVLLTIMDEIYVKANKNQKYASLCPDEFNLGLSIIDRRRGFLVPKYCRCQMKYQNTTNPASIFDNLEISDAGLAIIKQYIKKLPEVVDSVDHEFKKYKDFKFLTSEKLFVKPPQNDNLQLISLYKKLYDIQAKGHFYKIYSKRAAVVPKYKADELRGTPNVEIQPTHCITKRQCRVIPLPYLRREPEYHNIGDRVVIMRTQDTGVITGLNDGEIVINVPKKMHEYRYNFTEVFNEKWAGELDKREKGCCWNQQVSYYSPSYFNKVTELPQPR